MNGSISKQRFRSIYCRDQNLLKEDIINYSFAEDLDLKIRDIISFPRVISMLNLN